jgi:hypothetical protein
MGVSLIPASVDFLVQKLRGIHQEKHRAITPISM